jgi:hypothetical protein
MSSGREKMPATSMDQVFIRESALAVNELQEHLEDQLRVEGAGASSWTEFALIGMNAKCFKLVSLWAVLRKPEPSEPEPLHEQNLHRYLRIRGLSNTELINSVTGAGAVRAGAFP